MSPERDLSYNPVKNFKTKCEGLSPVMFLFTIVGNTTYALSICAASMEREYLIRNGSWLAGMSCRAKKNLRGNLYLILRVMNR